MALHFVNNAYSFIMMYMRQSVNAVSSVAFTAFLISVIISCGIAAEIYMRKADIHILSVLAAGTEKNASLSFLLLMIAFYDVFCALILSIVSLSMPTA